MVRVAQEPGQLLVAQGTVLVPFVKGDVSIGLLILWDFFDAHPLVPCNFDAESSTENFRHQALAPLPLWKDSRSVFLVDAKALQRQQL